MSVLGVRRNYLVKYLVMVTLAIIGFFIFATIAPQTTRGATRTYYVSPSGDDINDGVFADKPFKTIQRAVDVATAGDTITLGAGEYREDIVSRRNGTAENPIVISGPADAVMRGGGNDRIIEINHDFHTLNGFTINGFHGSSESKSGYRDILIYVLGKEIRSGVDGLKVLNMTLKNAGGECIRLRYFVTKSEIAHNTITDCGVYDFVFSSGGKNGEGVYIGTSNKQWGDGKNPTDDPDESRDNIVHNNYIETNGNECVDIKEGATANIVEYNTCRGQRDSESGGFGSRGDANIFRYNNVSGSVGAGIRLGGWLVDGVQYGKNNDVYENIIEDNKNGGIKFQVSPQGKVCGNTMSGNTGGDAVGDFGSEFDPTASCESISSNPKKSPNPKSDNPGKKKRKSNRP
jgi:parallel beta-helix repeat protein